MTERERVEWIDILKLLGILAIFCGHLGFDTGGLHDFVFVYHVPLFFFASGIFACTLENLSLRQAVKKRFIQIIVPYIFFCLISMLVLIFTAEKDIWTYAGYVKQFILGIRNQMPASSLWFFPCLFCMNVLFEVLRRCLKNKWLVLAAAVALYFAAIFVFPNRPDITPSWIFNIDSACFYLIYYVFGWLLHDKLLNERDTEKKSRGWISQIAYLAGVALLAVYAFCIYLKEDKIGDSLCAFIPGMVYIYPVLRVMLLILLNIILAKLLTGVGQLGSVGAQTMWLCGNELVVKSIFSALAEIIGVELKIQSALAAALYACFMVFVIIKLLVPTEKKVFQKCMSVFGE